jgi:cytochrome d ubiquinol oxidase subunit II
MGIDLSLIWAVIIFFGVMMYVVMDGFDLGIGILFPFAPSRSDRDVMMNTVAPIWDGNETWLVLGGAGLMAAFPLAYSIILSALYLPLIFMLLGLIFRGVAFEFRFKALEHERHLWDKAFIGGSLAAAFFQGVALGSYVSGIPVWGERYVGGALDWVAPFPLLTGLGLTLTYALLGGTWLVLKTDGELQRRMVGIARSLVPVLFAFIVVVFIWTFVTRPSVSARWVSWPTSLWLSPVPLLVVTLTIALRRSLRRRQPHALPFIFVLALIFVGYVALAISLWPNIIPPGISFWAAAAPPQSHGFALVGALLVIPFILMYTAWSYYVFRGKVRAHDSGYH